MDRAAARALRDDHRRGAGASRPAAPACPSASISPRLPLITAQCGTSSAGSGAAGAGSSTERGAQLGRGLGGRGDRIQRHLETGQHRVAAACARRTPAPAAAAETCAFAPEATPIRFSPAASTSTCATPVGARDRREAVEADAEARQVGARRAPVLVVAGRPHQLHVGAEARRGGRRVGALAALRDRCAPAGDGLAGRRQPRQAQHEIDVDRADDDDTRGHAGRRYQVWWARLSRRAGRPSA